jgi:hypothetical protein
MKQIDTLMQDISIRNLYGEDGECERQSQAGAGIGLLKYYHSPRVNG